MSVGLKFKLNIDIQIFTLKANKYDQTIHITIIEMKSSAN